MQEDVVIVGAGVSGLAAASVLHAAGTASFSVLEATDRTGGRIKQVGSAPSSAGTDWTLYKTAGQTPLFVAGAWHGALARRAWP